MLEFECLGVNSSNHLTIGGVDCVELAGRYGTPLYVMDENLIRKNCHAYKEAIDKFYDGKGLILYANKAFCCKYMCNIANEQGLGMDVVSGGELYTAIEAGFPMDKIYFEGNNKSYQELEMAIQNNVGRIVVDSEPELFTLQKLSQVFQKKVNVLFRIKPGVEAHTHEFITTGQIDSKFGFALENGEAMNIIKKARQMDGINIVGVQCHIGSQIFDCKPFEVTAGIMMDFIGDIKDELAIEIDELNLGGGYGIRYTPQDQPVDYFKYIEAVAGVVKQKAADRNVKLPFILMEPGRSIVGPAGITLYTVGFVKEIMSKQGQLIKKYVIVDGGMTDNPRHIMYGAKYHAILASDVAAQCCDIVTVAGKCCESGDVLVRDICLPSISPQDVIAIPATGAYNHSMSSNYNRLPRPPVVMVRDGVAKVVIKGETYADIIRQDV